MSLRADGRWEGRWRAPADGSGQRQWVRAFASSESTCDAALAAAIRDHKAGIVTGDGHQKVIAYLESWLRTHVNGPTPLKPSTRRNYDLHVRHMGPLIGSFELGQLRRRHVQTMVDTLAVEAGVRTAGAVHATLRSALNDLDEGVIQSNPAQKVHVPEYRRQVPEPWQLDEAQRFLESIEGTADEAMWLLAAYFGPRPYEILAISWDDLDLDKGLLRLNHGIQWPVGEEPYLDTIKSAAGHRTIRLAPRVVTSLRRHRKLQDDAKAAKGELWHDQGLVFVELGGNEKWSPGRPMRPDSMSHRFQRLIENLGMRRVRLYDLRRLASAVITATEGLDASARTLGQSDIRLAAMTYGYSLRESADRIAAGVESMLGRRPLPGDTPADSPASLTNVVLTGND